MTNKTTSAIDLLLVESQRELIAAQSDAITRLKAALERVRGVIESGYRGVDKADKCPHDRFGFEDCIACYDEALLAAIDGSSLGGE